MSELKKAKDTITKYMKLAKKKKVNNMTDINKTLNEIIELIESDALAASCQTMGQYRAILIKELRKAKNN